MEGNEEEEFMISPELQEEREKEYLPNSDKICCKCCGCCCNSLPVILAVLVPLCIGLFLEGYRLYAINQNIYFDKIYISIYLVIVLLLFICLALIIINIQQPRTTKKKYLRWIILTVAILFLLLGIWVCVYISSMYSKNDDYVYVTGIDKRNKYHDDKQTKCVRECEHNNEHDYCRDKCYRNKCEREGSEHCSAQDDRLEEDDPDVPLNEDDYDKGIDPNYKKHTKSYYIM